MPTYQYACTECGHRFEAVQSFSDDALTECPQCTGRLRKVFNSVGIVFKGSGFYRTDSREKAGAGAGKSEGGEGKTDGGKADGGAGKTDAKPAASTDSGSGSGKPSSSTPKPTTTATSGSSTAGSAA